MSPDELLERERMLRARELAVASRETMLGIAHAQEVRVPAEAAAEAFRAVVEHPQFADGDVRECARGLGVDPEWLSALLNGDRRTLDADDIAITCEALQCTPYALWAPEVAHETLVAYPPERWPARTGPLEDLLTGDDTFLSRRIEQQAAEVVSLSVVPQRLQPTTVTVTPYRIDGVLAVHERTGAIVTSSELTDQPARDYDYFFTFTQLGAREATVAYLHGGVLEETPPPGAEAPPDLVRIANDVAAQLPEANALEIRDASGTRHWIGRAPGTTTWESWSDPAANFPGDRNLVVHGVDDPPLGSGVHLMLCPPVPVGTLNSVWDDF